MITDPRNSGMDQLSSRGKRNQQETQTMSHGLSNFFGAVAAWLCLAPVAFAHEPLSMPGTLPAGFTAAHYIANLSLILIWITGGIFLVVGGLLAFEPLRFLTRKSDPLSVPARVNRNTEINLAWTAIPVLVVLLFLA
jgi:cytochrome c oxidase subunit 2